MDQIYEDLTSYNDDVVQNKIVLTGSQLVAVTINSGVITTRQGMKTTQEMDASVIVQQMAVVKAHAVLMVVDANGIFMHLLHICCQGGIPT